MMPRRVSRLAATALSALVALGLAAGAALAACRDDVVDLRGPWGQARFTVELADTEASRARGLMHREFMPRMAGMLFLYDRPGRPRFWMANTLIPLDMLFFAPDGSLTRVHHEAIPHDRTPIDGGPGVLAVLEINGGLARQLRISDTGTEMRHPRLDQSIAVWPCD